MATRQETEPEGVLMSMLYPAGSRPDNSPLSVLCCNDTCSFTWTGDEHINQVRSQTFSCPSDSLIFAYYI